MITLYRILFVIFTPFLKAWIYIRCLRGKEHKTRFLERFAKTRLKRPEGPLFWFHGASNGECLSFLSLIKHYQSRFPEARFLITSHTLTSSELVQAKLPRHAMHQFIPLDHPWFVKRFLDHWKPDVAFWVESELWPTILDETSKRMPLIMLNGRLSQKSYENWKKAKGLAAFLFSRFSLIFCQSQEALKRFKDLGASHAHFMGNLKFSGRPLDANPQKVEDLKKHLTDRKVWAASCTHPGEEGIILKAHKILKETMPDLLTIMVPRHPHRADKLRYGWEEEGFSVAQRSLAETPTKKTDFYLFDVTGELGLLYTTVDVVLMGGSLVDMIGGHNPLEAANLKCALLSGPHTKNNQEIYDLFQEQKAIRVVTDEKSIAQTVKTLLENPDSLKNLSKKGLDLASKQRKVLDDLTQAIEKAEGLPC